MKSRAGPNDGWSRRRAHARQVIGGAIPRSLTLWAASSGGFEGWGRLVPRAPRGGRLLTVNPEGLWLWLLCPGRVHVAAWVETLKARYDVPSVKQHLAAVRMLFD